MRRNLLSTGGALSIVGGISQIVCGGLLIADYVASFPHYERLIYALLLPALPDTWAAYVLWNGVLIPFFGDYVPSRWVMIGGFLCALGIVAIVGGVSAIKGKRFGLSLAGAMCSLPSVFLGILAVIFVALGRREFGVKV
jgi:hypothetical protein